MNWTAAVIVSQKRAKLVVEHILPAILDSDPHQTLVVGDLDNAETRVLDTRPWHYLHIPDLTKTTNDALVKRDVAALACTSDWIAYFSDDHKPQEDFGERIQALRINEADVWVPRRIASQSGHVGERLNMGELDHYCGGHAGVFRVSMLKKLPWCAGAHHREWDRLNALRHQEAGYRYRWTDSLTVIDVEPGATPWL